MAEKNQKAEKEAKKGSENQSELVRVHVGKIIGPYPWKEEHKIIYSLDTEKTRRVLDLGISSKRSDSGLISLMMDIERDGFREDKPLYLIKLDEAPSHVENKEGFKPGLYTISGRNRWEAVRNLGIPKLTEVPVVFYTGEDTSYEAIALEAINDNIQQKLVAQRGEEKVDKDNIGGEETAEKKKERAGGASDKDLTLANLRYLKMKMLGYDPKKGNKLKGLKHVVDMTKDPEKKQKVSQTLSALEASTITRVDLAKILDIDEGWVTHNWWYGLAIKEDMKENGIRPAIMKKSGGSKYARWVDMAVDKGVKATGRAYRYQVKHDNQPEPSLPSSETITIKVNQGDILTTSVYDFKDKVLEKIEEKPEGIFFPRLTCKAYDKEEDVPEEQQGKGMNHEGALKAITETGDDGVEKKSDDTIKLQEKVKELESQIDTLNKELEEVTEGRGAEHDKRMKVEKDLEKAKASLEGGQEEEVKHLKEELEMAQNREKGVQETLTKKIDELREIKDTAIKELTALKEGKKTTDNPNFEHRFTSVDIDQMYAWQKQKLASTMEAQGGAVGAVKVYIEFEPKAVKK